MPPAPDANQSPPFEDVNLWTADAALRQAVEREGGEDLTAFGAGAGSAEAFERGRLANEHPPLLHRYDLKGNRIDRVEFHPAYHRWMADSIGHGIHALGWNPDGTPAPGGQVARLARLYMTTQAEPGHVCPVTMTAASVAAMRQRPELAARMLPTILSRDYDPSHRPWQQKPGMTLGMGMTERQGGTDVRANTTAAEPGDGAHLLTGHKWFLSAPMSDAFLMLAQAPGGLSCFMVPRLLPDSAANGLRLERLKDKLGNRSNASVEVELIRARGTLVGEEGRGVATIIGMVTLTRLDCAVASAGQMRLALALALHHCRHRAVFGRLLADQPLMAAVLADMALDVEAATALAFRLAGAFDRAATDPAEAAWCRVMTPVTKYWVCKIAPALGYEAVECLGGNGYVEGPAARLYRELPLNAIWEGSGNVMALDLLRVLAKEPEAVATVADSIAAIAPGDPAVASALDRLRNLSAEPSEATARHLAELLARTAAAALLRAHAPAEVADGFASRLEGGFRHTYGAGPLTDAGAILARALPG